jgi:hypothetical protein
MCCFFQLTIKKRVAADGTVLVLQTRLGHSIQLGQKVIRHTLDLARGILGLLHQFFHHATQQIIRRVVGIVCTSLHDGKGICEVAKGGRDVAG